MDIFKLGEKILALLEMVFGFWNNQVGLVFALLGQSPVTFKGGGPWQIVESIEPISSGIQCELAVSILAQSDIMVFVRSDRSFFPKKDNGSFLNFSASARRLIPLST